MKSILTNSLRIYQFVKILFKNPLTTLCTQSYNVYTKLKGGATLGPKPGQKLTDKPKDIILHIRVDEQTNEELNECARELNTDKSKVVRMGIQMVKQSLKK